MDYDEFIGTLHPLKINVSKKEIIAGISKRAKTLA